MSTLKKKGNEKSIDTVDEISMREAVLRSGYLLERRVATLLREEGYKSLTNRGFIDQETSKSREYDVYAYKDIRIGETGPYSIYPTIICECKNNPQPIVFFVQEEEEFKPLIDEVTVSGIPAKIWQLNKYISIQEFAEVKNFHHYCKPIAPVSTQCCTFEMKKDKSSWMASHGEELYETFRTLTKALDQEISDDFRNMSQWFDTEEKEKEFIDLSFYYPLVVFQGDIYAAYIGKDDLNFKKFDHVQYNPEFFSLYENEVVSYHVDAISEAYLPSYLKIIEREAQTIKHRLQQKKEDVIASTNRLIIECNSVEKKPSSYRKYLEYLF